MADNETTTAATAELSNDVSAVKGLVAGGYAFSAPIGTTLPTGSNPYADLDTGFENLSYVSDDGVEEELDTDAEEVVDLNGDVVCVIAKKNSEKVVLTLINSSKAALCEMYGHQNVTDETNHIEVRHTTREHDRRSYVFDFALKDGRRWREVVPNGQVAEVGTVTKAANNVFSREITIACAPDANGVRIYDYIQKAAASAATTTTGA